MAHNHDVAGSNPAPATRLDLIGMGKLKGRGLGSRLGPQKSRLRSASVGDGGDRRRVAMNPLRRAYGTARWKRLVEKIKQRDQWTCQQTGELLNGKYPAPNSPAVDHIRPHRGDPELFWDENNMQLVSKGWHDREKQRQEAMGEV